MSVLDVALEHYLDRLSDVSRDNRSNVLERFFGWCGVGPSEAVAFQRMVSSRLVEFDEDLFNRVKDTLKDKVVAGSSPEFWFVDAAYCWFRGRDVTVSTKRSQWGMIRGFFVANRCGLPKDKPKFHSKKVPVEGRIEFEELRSLFLSFNLKYRAVGLVAFFSGSGVGELIYINEHHAHQIFDGVKKGKDIVCLDMPGRKQYRNAQPYYTFVAGDAIDALRQYFHSRGWKRDTVLFRNSTGVALTRDNFQHYLKRKAFEIGLIKRKTPPCLKCGGETVRKLRKVDDLDKICYFCASCQKGFLASEYNRDNRDYGSIRYRVKAHELRDVFKTEFQRAQAYAKVSPECAEFFMGHEIDPLQYGKIMRDRKYGEDQYRKALPYLNILSEDPRKVDRVDVETQLEASRAEARAMSEKLISLERDVESGREALRLLSDPEVLDGLKEILKKHKK